MRLRCCCSSFGVAMLLLLLEVSGEAPRRHFSRGARGLDQRGNWSLLALGKSKTQLRQLVDGQGHALNTSQRKKAKSVGAAPAVRNSSVHVAMSEKSGKKTSQVKTVVRHGRVSGLATMSKDRKGSTTKQGKHESSSNKEPRIASTSGTTDGNKKGGRGARPEPRLSTISSLISVEFPTVDETPSTNELNVITALLCGHVETAAGDILDSQSSLVNVANVHCELLEAADSTVPLSESFRITAEITQEYSILSAASISTLACMTLRPGVNQPLVDLLERLALTSSPFFGIQEMKCSPVAAPPSPGPAPTMPPTEPSDSLVAASATLLFETNDRRFHHLSFTDAMELSDWVCNNVLRSVPSLLAAGEPLIRAEDVACELNVVQGKELSVYVAIRFSSTFVPNTAAASALVCIALKENPMGTFTSLSLGSELAAVQCRGPQTVTLLRDSHSLRPTYSRPSRSKRTSKRHLLRKKQVRRRLDHRGNVFTRRGKGPSSKGESSEGQLPSQRQPTNSRSMSESSKEIALDMDPPTSSSLSIVSAPISVTFPTVNSAPSQAELNSLTALLCNHVENTAGDVLASGAPLLISMGLHCDLVSSSDPNVFMFEITAQISDDSAFIPGPDAIASIVCMSLDPDQNSPLIQNLDRLAQTSSPFFGVRDIECDGTGANSAPTSAPRTAPPTTTRPSVGPTRPPTFPPTENPTNAPTSPPTVAPTIPPGILVPASVTIEFPTTRTPRMEDIDALSDALCDHIEPSTTAIVGSGAPLIQANEVECSVTTVDTSAGIVFTVDVPVEFSQGSRFVPNEDATASLVCLSLENSDLDTFFRNLDPLPSGNTLLDQEGVRCDGGVAIPTNVPTTIRSTNAPTAQPSRAPVRPPTATPTRIPTSTPPTKTPSLRPTNAPVVPPTFVPTTRPTSNPTRVPSPPTESPTISPPTTSTPSVSTRPPTEVPTRPPLPPDSPTDSPISTSRPSV